MIKAIETSYKGYRFRSRLEARWAVFFDALGVRWQYEVQGYQLSDGRRYLPDFFLPDVRRGLLVEVKPEGADLAPAAELLRAVCEGVGSDGVVVAGAPDPESDEYIMVGPNGEWDQPYKFCICPICDKVGLTFDGRGARVCGGKVHHVLDGFDKMYTYDSDKLLRAVVAARGARFEHGESGAARRDRWATE